MTTLLEYKGYFGSVEYSDADEIFHGRLEFIRDLVVDLSQFYQQYRSIQPYLVNHDPEPEIERLQLPDERAELDGLIAHLYGLSEEEFAHILTAFPLVSDPVKVAARNAYRDVQRGLLK